MKLIIAVAVGLGCLLSVACAPSRSELPMGKVGMPSTEGKLTRTVNRTVMNEPGSSLISEIYASDKCDAISRGGFIWMTDKALLEDLLLPQGADVASRVSSGVNFATQGALMVDFGSTPTPAYRVNLIANKLQLKGPKAIVQVDLVKPATNGKKMVQMVSHPCAVYVMPRVGYTTLEVQSGLGDVFTTFGN